MSTARSAIMSCYGCIICPFLCVDEENQVNAPRGWAVEFNVPWSTSSGYPVNSIPEDKYNVRFDQGGCIQSLKMNGLIVRT